MLIKGMRIQLRLVSDQPVSDIMLQRLGCAAAVSLGISGKTDFINQYAAIKSLPCIPQFIGVKVLN